MPSWIGPWEIGIVLVIVLLIFGPRKLPELGSSLGKSIRGFRKGMKDGGEEPDETVAEASEATTSEAPVSKSETTSTTAATEAAAAVATAEAPAGAGAAGSGRPQCFGAWEQGDPACEQCIISTDCADVVATAAATAGGAEGSAAAATAAEASGRAPVAEAPRPQCFGTWEEGDADCQQCTIGTDCAVAAAAAKSA
jgi:sec-independent protein translocase protein TatA